MIYAVQDERNVCHILKSNTQIINDKFKSMWIDSVKPFFFLSIDMFFNRRRKKAK